MKIILNLVTVGLPSLFLALTATPSLAIASLHHPQVSIAPTLQAQTPQATSQVSKLNQGRAYFNSGQFAQAAEIWEQAAQDYATRGDSLHQALSLNYLSLAYQHLSQWDVAQTAIESSLKLVESATSNNPLLSAQILNTKARLLFHTGQNQSALETFQRAQKYYDQAVDKTGAFISKINQAEALQSLGFYNRAKDILEEINQQLATTENSTVKVGMLRSLGIALQVLGDVNASREVLEQSLSIAQDMEATNQLGIILLSLGNTALDAGDNAAALDYFKQAEKATTNPEEKVKIRLNQLRLYLQLEQWQNANAIATKIYQKLSQLQPSRSSVYGAVNLAASWQKMGYQGKSLTLQQVNQILVQAVKSARKLKDAQAEAYALYHWGKLYSSNGQLADAIKLTQKSLIIAQQINATEISSQAAWQLGKLHKKQGKLTEAIAAYTEAVKDLKTLRGDLVSINPDIQFSFRKSVEPVYRELVELLLDGNPSQENLKKARQVIEDLQLAELDNFFRQACLDANVAEIDQIDRSATVIYPIILPERLAVIVSAPGKPIGYYSTSVSAAEVEQNLTRFLSSLHPVFKQDQRLPHLQKVYDWLIRPAEQEQILTDTKTLVFILDGKLRKLPMAALHDGEQYLVEKYNISVSLGLQLLDPQPLRKEKFSIIAGGLSEARQGFKSLPGVKQEIEQIAKSLNPDSVMLNQEFTSNRVSKEITTKTSNVIHLATHGQFSSKAEETFILTWENKINVQELEQLLRSQQLLGEDQIDLLVLSACQTAKGDDQAMLGLAGFAIKSGARSTLGTLWKVRDDSTAIFINKFYEYLKQPEITKAEAVRKAQLDLIGDSKFNEPLFWAPFILVGNWL